MGLCLLTVWRYFECFVGARVRYVRVLTIDDHVIQLDRTEGRTDGHCCHSFFWRSKMGKSPLPSSRMCFRQSDDFLSLISHHNTSRFQCHLAVELRLHLFSQCHSRPIFSSSSSSSRFMQMRVLQLKVYLIKSSSSSSPALTTEYRKGARRPAAPGRPAGRQAGRQAGLGPGGSDKVFVAADNETCDVMAQQPSL